MKKFILALLAATVIAVWASALTLPMSAPIPTPRPDNNFVTVTGAITVVDGNKIRVLDGDTVALPCAVPARGCAEKVRLTSIDTAEVFHFRCENELVVGLAAKQAAVDFLRDHQVEIIRTGKQDRYRRTLADLHVDGVDLGEHLLGLGLAVSYRPGRAAWLERARTWCPAFIERTQ